MLQPEDPGHAFLQVHPAARTPGLEQEMLKVAEERLAHTAPDGRRSLHVWANADDPLRVDLLTRRGYTRDGNPEFQRRRAMDAPILDAPPADGYRVRALGDREELPSRGYASWRAFHPDEPDERFRGWEWYLYVQRAPLYRRDLDIVATAPGGE